MLSLTEPSGICDLSFCLNFKNAGWQHYIFPTPLFYITVFWPATFKKVLNHEKHFSSRIHFGMNGSLRINPGASRNGSGASAVLEIQLTADLVCFYDATLEIR